MTILVLQATPFAYTLSHLRSHLHMADCPKSTCQFKGYVHNPSSVTCIQNMQNKTEQAFCVCLVVIVGLNEQDQI